MKKMHIILLVVTVFIVLAGFSVAGAAIDPPYVPNLTFGPNPRGFGLNWGVALLVIGIGMIVLVIVYYLEKIAKQQKKLLENQKKR
ncbi:hypothetical protein KKE19_00860 [Patescibacteria group bacterium]|nr:hypothetical protein [Patescibacteria group bacterium]MBU4274344.1 hypothetical protein [Patescibacteria group bacterium]MBU4367548.1 hypothetical protein [Patescibacteria group bacterium]MBU4461589.1 hypothetical protein [Patescibacteria group bacterium]MCG2699486.1 hypothetical protein [Candidatus Parcubacteria bacterium]